MIPRIFYFKIHMAISDRAQLDAAPFLVSRQMALSAAGYCPVQDGTLCFWGGGQAERKWIRLEAVSQMRVAAYCINRGLLQELGAVPCWKTDCFLYKSDKKLEDLVCITSNITCKA